MHKRFLFESKLEIRNFISQKNILAENKIKNLKNKINEWLSAKII
jgi:hypothetical protein